MKVSTDDILEALRAALQAPDATGAKTVQELMKELRVSRSDLMAMLHQFADEGRLEAVKVPRRDLSGRLASIPAYRIKAK